MADTDYTHEIWKDIPTHIGLYQVSDMGRVFSLERTFRALRKGRIADVRMKGRILRPFTMYGYPAVSLVREGKSRTYFVHQLVCMAWHGLPSTGQEVAHGDGNRSNCHPENLRWATRRENSADKLLHGTQRRGNDLWFTKVPDEALAEIRNSTVEMDAANAARFGVSRSHVAMIRTGHRRLGAL